jgi:hypothetical protein
MLGLRNLDYYQGKVDALNDTISFIDTLEVKEVDLEKELIKWHKEHFKKDGTFIGMSGFYLTNNSQMDIAKHFFGLGVNASNPLTWEDIKLIWNITDEMDNMPEEEFYKEVLKRFKARKGE